MPITDSYLHPSQKKEVAKIHRKYANKEKALEEMEFDEKLFKQQRNRLFEKYKEEINAFYAGITGKEEFAEPEPKKKAPRKKKAPATKEQLLS